MPTNTEERKVGMNISHPQTMRGLALVDLENLCIFNGHRLALTQAAGVCTEIDTFVAGLPTTAALACSLFAAYLPLLSARTWSIDMVQPGPDSADLALLERGHFAATHGVTDLVVVSGDHAFAELAAHARIHVVSHRDRLSRVLASAATSVTYLASGEGLRSAA